MRAIARSRRRAGVFAVSALVAVVGGLGIAQATTAATPSHSPGHHHAEQAEQHEQHGEHG